MTVFAGFTQFILIMLIASIPLEVNADDVKSVSLQTERNIELKLFDLDQKLLRFSFDLGLEFNYPDAVRGIYVTGQSAGGERLKSLLNLVESTDLKILKIILAT